jgi:nucleotide-binding universal stress UspA family protein
MIEMKHVLCPVDLSGFSRHALEHAMAVAKWYGGKVTALQVLPPVATSIPATPAGFPPVLFTPEDLGAHQAQLTAFLAGAGADVPVDAMVVEGSITAEIVRVARELDVDLLVMGTHGRSGFDRLLLGSTTEKMLRKAPCPLLTVPARESGAAPGPLLYARILCAVDFSPSSLRALAFAESFAKEADAALTVLHVVEPAHSFEAMALSTPGASPFDPEMRVTAKRRLQEAISAEARTYSHVREAVTDGIPYKEILRVANEVRSELIVMGAHGGHIGLMAFGSTTNHVVRQASCAVLTLKADKP